MLRLQVHCQDAGAVAATADTIEAMVPGMHVVTRDQDGAPLMVDGEIEVHSSDPDFVAWAAVQQGYVASAREV